MKNLALLLAISLTSPLLSQEVTLTYDIATGRASYEKIIEVEGKTAIELYEICEKWVAYTFKNEDAVTQSKIEGEMLRGEGIDKNQIVYHKVPLVLGDFKFQFQIDIKEGKIRFRTYDLDILSPEGVSSNCEQFLYRKDGSEKTYNYGQRIRANIIESITEIVISLENILFDKKTKDDEW